jgi:hypothetical protein
VLKVRLGSGSVVFVEAEHLLDEGSDDERLPEGAGGGLGDDLELGSDSEPEDGEEELGDLADSEPSRARARRAPREGGEEEAPVEDGWQETVISSCPRLREHHAPPRRGRMLRLKDTQRDDPLAYFLSFMPMEELDAAAELMQAAGKEKWPDFSLDRGVFLQWLGLWFKMLRWRLHNRREYWEEVDAQKEYVAQYKATTACTLRITKPWHGSGRIVIGDAWFGSVRTVEELRDKGLYSVMCVKQGCAGYPKKELLEACKERGDQMFMQVKVVFDDGVERPVLAGAHMDKKPLLLCATCSTSLPGEPKVRYRSRLHNGVVEKSTYTLEQPQMHALYRANFNAVDMFNRMSLAPGSLVEVWQTPRAWHRVFAGVLSFIETNAFFAFNAYNDMRVKLTKAQWHSTLADALVNNPFLPRAPEQVLSAEALEGHGTLTRGKQARCAMCPNRSVQRCQCGVALCSPMTGRKCVAQHVVAAALGESEARPRCVGRPRKTALS